MTRENAKKNIFNYNDILQLMTAEEICRKYEQRIDEIFTYFESQLSSITRIEVISPAGRDYGRWCREFNHFKVSIQDDGKTLKLFEVSND